MLVLIRSNSIISDPRVEKYIRYYNEQKINYKIIGWDRLGEGLIDDHIDYFRLKSMYNQGGLKAVVDRIKWMIYVYRYLRTNNENVDFIHACDLDTAFPSVLYKYIHNKKLKVIFDIFDWYTANFHNNRKIILFVFRLMERFTTKHADEIIICEPERIEQIPYKLSKKELILPNIPSFTDTDFLMLKDDYQFNNDKITFSYVGGLGAERFLDELLDVAEKELINLLIAGYGDIKMEQRCWELNNLENIKYFGKVDYKLGLNIMYNSDIIYAMYCRPNPNHIYAAPNKYYEAMMLQKPILSTKGISISNKIINQQIGYVINESLTELEYLVHSLRKEEMIEKGKNAGILWETKFKTYTSDFLKGTYQKIISQEI